MCNYESQTDCSRVTGTDSGIGDVTETCLVGQEGDIKANPKVCSSYLVCNNLKFVSKPCPTGQFWDVPTEECMSRKTATPAATCDRCEGTKGNTFVNSVDSTCQGYLTCKDGKKTGSSSCASGYFDEDSVACIINGKPAQTDAYKDTHGACSAATTCTCGPEENAKCISTADCQCGYDVEGVGGVCIECTADAVSGVCTGPACACAGTTTCADPANAACVCGFDATITCTNCEAKACNFYCVLTGTTCANEGTVGSSDCGNSASGVDDCVPCINGLEPSATFCAADL